MLSKCKNKPETILFSLDDPLRLLHETVSQLLSSPGLHTCFFCTCNYQPYARVAGHTKSGMDHRYFPPLSCVIHLLLRWHFSSELIHQGTIDLLAAAQLHLSIKPACQIKWRLRNFFTIDYDLEGRLARRHDYPLSLSWDLLHTADV